MTNFDALWKLPALRPLAPLVLAAWHDGHLTPAELLAIHEALERSAWLDDGTRGSLARWLDPETPPPPKALRELERAVSELLRGLPSDGQRTLSDIGAALVDANLGATHVRDARAVLASVQEALSTDAIAETREKPRTDRARQAPHFSEAEREALRAVLDGEQRAIRDHVRGLLADTRFRFVSELGTHAYREQVLSWLRALAEGGLLDKCYPNGIVGGRDVPRFMAVFDTLSFFDLSLVVKFGVQEGLFAGAIENLGSEQHHALLPSILRGELLGCFAMTERGHGSNVRALLTSARYEPESESFVIHSPSLAAGKEWIGNAALHGRMAVVFAQLETLGEGYGVHAFLVPIRDEDGQPMAGVRIEDCGEKMGLNGVDNGRLWFDNVRVPREALLDRFGQVAADGSYQSKIPSSSKRFFTMLATLVGGRISVAGGATSASKVGLAIALRYATERTQFAGTDGREKSLMRYLTHRRRLLPRLAAAYALSIAQQELVKRSAVTDDASARDVETLAAGLKAIGTWQAIDTLQQCRECCGGQGYLTSNRIDALRTDTDVFTTFEGDNTVLLQLVANNLLHELTRALAKKPVRTLVRSLVEDVVVAVSNRNPIAQRSDDDASLRSPELHASALRFREKSLLQTLARRVAHRVDEGMDRQDAFEQCQDHAMALARAHIESFVLTAFQKVASEQPVLEPLCALYGLWCVERDLAWFLENGFMAAPKSRAVRTAVNALVDELAPQARELVDAFGIPESCLGPLADERYLAASGLASGDSSQTSP